MIYHRFQKQNLGKNVEAIGIGVKEKRKSLTEKGGFKTVTQE